MVLGSTSLAAMSLENEKALVMASLFKNLVGVSTSDGGVVPGWRVANTKPQSPMDGT